MEGEREGKEGWREGQKREREEGERTAKYTLRRLLYAIQEVKPPKSLALAP